MNKPQISIIYPVYNTELFVQESIRSCIHQTCNEDDYEIIIVDDGSTDKSMEMVFSETESRSNVKIIRQKNSGLSAARNKGISVASGDYIWCVDSDDLIETDSIEKIIDVIKKGACDIIAIGAKEIRNGVFRERTKYLNVIKGEACSGKELLKTKFRPNCAPFYVFKREFLSNNRLHFFEGIYYEDTEFTPRAINKSANIGVVRSQLYTVQINDKSITRSRITEKKCLDQLFVSKRLIKNGWINDDPEIKKYFYRIACNPLSSFMASYSYLSSPNVRQAFKNNRKYIHYLVYSSKPEVMIEGLLSFLPSIIFIQIYRLSRSVLETMSVKKKIH